MDFNEKILLMMILMQSLLIMIIELKEIVTENIFLPRVDINDYNILIDGRNFYYQNIPDNFKKYEELRKVMTGRGEDYTTGTL